MWKGFDFIIRSQNNFEMTTIFQKFDNASPWEVAAYLKECLAASKEGATPQEVAGYIAALLGCENPFSWYAQNIYPTFTKIIDLASSLEIGNVSFSEETELAEIAGLIAGLEVEMCAA